MLIHMQMIRCQYDVHDRWWYKTHHPTSCACANHDSFMPKRWSPCVIRCIFLLSCLPLCWYFTALLNLARSSLSYLHVQLIRSMMCPYWYSVLGSIITPFWTSNVNVHIVEWFCLRVGWLPTRLMFHMVGFWSKQVNHLYGDRSYWHISNEKWKGVELIYILGCMYLSIIIDASWFLGYNVTLIF